MSTVSTEMTLSAPDLSAPAGKVYVLAPSGGGAAEEDAVEPGRGGRRAAAALRGQRDAGLLAGAGEPAAVPGAAGVEAVVVGEQHRQRAGRGGAVRGGPVGHLPAGVVEAGLRLGRLLGVLPAGERGQRDGRGGRQGAGAGCRCPWPRCAPGGRSRSRPWRRRRPRPRRRRRCRRSGPGASRRTGGAAQQVGAADQYGTGRRVLPPERLGGRGVGEQQEQRVAAAADPHPGQAGVLVVEPQVAGGRVPGGGHRAAGGVTVGRVG